MNDQLVIEQKIWSHFFTTRRVRLTPGTLPIMRHSAMLAVPSWRFFVKCTIRS
jgi:hypothetical protein